MSATTEPYVDPEQYVEPWELFRRLRKDVRDAARILTDQEARYLVDSYYQRQENRKRSANQLRAADEGTEPNAALAWIAETDRRTESAIQSLLGAFAQQHVVGRWSMSQYGIGPVLSAGLLAHIDIHKAPHVGHIYRFAGLAPGVEWKKGERRPWNAQLKTLAWKAGQCFMKFSGREQCFYGKLYRERKALEVERNERGDFADQAAQKLERFNIGKTTDAYKAYSSGKLPPAHIDARARRWAVKLFLSHWHEVAYTAEFGEPPDRAWVLEHGGHTDYIAPPGWDGG